MNNIINFYYGINIIDIYNYQNKYIFKYNDKKYYFVKYDRDFKDIKSLVDICEELKKRNILTNELVYNKFNNYVTPYNGELFVLIKENVKEYQINFNDILYIQNSTANSFLEKSLIRNNYVDLWQKKIDFYESKLKDINDRYQLINNTMNYYIGLGENAIEFLVNNNIKTNQIVLSHRRIDDKRTSIDFYNPLNYILDNRARDVADYIKALFFYEEISEENVLSFLYYINFNREEYILFVARMLYPTYYFDLIDKILFFKEDEDILKNVISKNEAYIGLMRRIFYYINNNLRMNIPIIEWIIKT